MTGETIKVFLMLSLFGALECALLVPDNAAQTSAREIQAKSG